MAVPATVTLYVREVHEVIDLIGTLFNRYYGLLTAAEMGSLVSGLEGTYAVPLTGPAIYSGPETRPPARPHYRNARRGATRAQVRAALTTQCGTAFASSASHADEQALSPRRRLCGARDPRPASE